MHYLYLIKITSLHQNKLVTWYSSAEVKWDINLVKEECGAILDGHVTLTLNFD